MQSVVERIAELNAPQLSKEKRAKIIKYHKEHGDWVKEIVGPIDEVAVLVRVSDSHRQKISIVDMLTPDGEYIEVLFSDDSSEKSEHALLDDWFRLN